MWTPFNNRIAQHHLTDDERLALTTAGKDYGFLRASFRQNGGWEDVGHLKTFHPEVVYRAKTKPVFTLEQVADAITALRDLNRDIIVVEYNTVDMLEWLMAENAALAAWQCPFTDGKTGLVSDEYGNQYCAKDRDK